MPSNPTPGMPEHGDLGHMIGDLQRRVGGLERTRRLQRSAIGSGGITVRDGGAITFLNPAGDVLATLDSSGLTVGGDVEINSSGLHVDGGLIQGIWADSADEFEVGASLTTTLTEFCRATIDPPSWVQQLTVFAFARAGWDNSSGGVQKIESDLVLDAGGASEDNVTAGETRPDGATGNAVTIEEITIPLSPAGRSVDVALRSRVTSGTASGLITLKVLAIGFRTSFT